LSNLLNNLILVLFR